MQVAMTPLLKVVRPRRQPRVVEPAHVGQTAGLFGTRARIKARCNRLTVWNGPLLNAYVLVLQVAMPPLLQVVRTRRQFVINVR